MCDSHHVVRRCGCKSRRVAVVACFSGRCIPGELQGHVAQWGVVTARLVKIHG